MKTPRIPPALILFVGCLATLLYLCPEVFLSPNSTLPGRGEDALKNNFTPAWHIQHDSTYTWFEGMNYPFGEHIVFTDAQPAISNSIKFFSRHVIDISGYSTFILNFLLLFSLFPAAIFIFRILKKFGTPETWAACSAVLIIALSPQLFRFPGHFALGYVVFFPGLWLLQLNYLEKGKFFSSIAVLLWVLFWTFVHPYYLMISILFLGAGYLINLIFAFSEKPGRRAISGFCFHALLPFIIFRTWLFLTDPVADRPQNPFGFFEFRAWWSSVFLPIYLPHGKFLETLIDFTRINWEGVAYVGIMGTAFVLISFFTLLIRFIRAFQGKPGSEPVPPLLMMSAIAAILILLFSMRYPFVWFMREWVYHIPGLSQFRSIGRFAWIFYYVWTTLAAWGFGKICSTLFERNYKVPAVMVAVFFFGSFSAESFLWIRFIRSKQTGPQIDLSGKSAGKELEWIASVKTTNYAALMVLPYFHIGSENFNISNDNAVKPALAASRITGLPLVNSMMSRTSFLQSLEQYQLIMEELHPLAAAPLYGRKPLLILSLKTLEHDRPYFLPSKSKLIFENEAAALYEITWHELMAVGTKVMENEISTFELKASSLLHPSDSVWMSAEDPYYFYESMDDSMPEMQFRGKGGVEHDGWDYNYLFKKKLGNSVPEKIIVSVWMLAAVDQRPHSEFWVECVDDDGIAHHFYNKPVGSFATALDRGWLLVEHEFTVNPGEEVRVMLRKDAKFPRKVRYDEFLMRRAGNDVYFLKDGYFVHNNRWWELRNKVVTPVAPVEVKKEIPVPKPKTVRKKKKTRPL